MSTFFGGETLINVAVINGSSNVPQTVYTVPAGRFAEIFIQRFDSFQSGTIIVGARSYSISGGSVQGLSEKYFTLYAGQSCSFSVGTGSGSNFDWYIVSKEFAIP